MSSPESPKEANLDPTPSTVAPPWTVRQLLELLINGCLAETAQLNLSMLNGSPQEGPLGLVEQFAGRILKVIGDVAPDASPSSNNPQRLDQPLTAAQVARLLEGGWEYGDPSFRSMGILSYEIGGQGNEYNLTPIQALLSHVNFNLSGEGADFASNLPSPRWFFENVDPIIQALRSQSVDREPNAPPRL